jgi:hypothetical protein
VLSHIGHVVKGKINNTDPVINYNPQTKSVLMSVSLNKTIGTQQCSFYMFLKVVSW